MKNNNDKPWYEKVSIWVGIIAGICTILAFIYNVSSAGDSNILKIFNNKINVGDQSPVIIGSGNTINYGNTKDNVSETTSKEQFLVVASYDMNTVQSSINGIDVLIKAETSFKAEQVTISGVSANSELKSTNMHGGGYEWYFKANFYIKGNYTITITAYNSEGESTSDVFEFTY